MASAGISLFWIPLGAGGTGFVRFNGRLYEAVQARRERRRPLSLLHTALEVRMPEGDFVIEAMWPSPDDDMMSRGVVVSGPVFAPWLSRTRVFRYEVRSWRGGALLDRDHAIGGPTLLSAEVSEAQALLDSISLLPPLTWGRDEAHSGEMWNSNSVISWLLTRVGYPIEGLKPPTGTRAPGWDAGIWVAGGST